MFGLWGLSCSFGCDYKYLKAPHNSPATVPGPGKYVADKTRFGVRIFSKHTDSPAFRFGKEQYTNACDGPTKVKCVPPSARVAVLEPISSSVTRVSTTKLPSKRTSDGTVVDVRMYK